MYDENYYHKHSRLRTNYRIKFTLNLLKISGEKPLRILDLGCGVGTYSKVLVKEGHRVLSVDTSKEALLHSKANGIANLGLISATSLPFKENTFDRILFLDVFEHLREPRKALKEIYRVLSPEGLLILSTSYPSFAGKYLYSMDPTHQKLYSVQEVKELLESATFREIHVVIGSFLERFYPFDSILRRLLKTITTIRALK
jgi:2-polyprenyl-3-methyl-5-hydroxy-6-metoxy-1,4-benzoquinol methylase